MGYSIKYDNYIILCGQCRLIPKARTHFKFNLIIRREIYLLSKVCY